MSTAIYSILFPVLIYFVVTFITKKRHATLRTWPLLTACVVFSLSIFAPSPQVDSQQTHFLTHILGGIVVGLLWLYFRPLYGPQKWWFELGVLLVSVSTLGVLNELFELFVYVSGLYCMTIGDTSWDLLANVIGVIIFYAVYFIAEKCKSLLYPR